MKLTMSISIILAFSVLISDGFYMPHSRIQSNILRNSEYSIKTSVHTSNLIRLQQTMTSTLNPSTNNEWVQRIKSIFHLKLKPFVVLAFILVTTIIFKSTAVNAAGPSFLSKILDGVTASGASFKNMKAGDSRGEFAAILNSVGTCIVFLGLTVIGINLKKYFFKLY